MAAKMRANADKRIRISTSIGADEITKRLQSVQPLHLSREWT
jgi:hypothetical protein